jgi:hypothetical protein
MSDHIRVAGRPPDTAWTKRQPYGERAVVAWG